MILDIALVQAGIILLTFIFFVLFVCLFLNFQDSATDKVTDLTVNVSDYVNETNLHSFERLVTLKLLTLVFCSPLSNGFIA